MPASTKPLLAGGLSERGGPPADTGWLIGTGQEGSRGMQQDRQGLLLQVMPDSEYGGGVVGNLG